ncbi:MAG: glycosyltransferase family 2 protein [Bacteroidota bacterium]|nr:MAG: glycosyltransferase family 2 protein [Bacteroidota bacterium]
MIDVSIITLNYNSTAYTLQCIKSIEEKTAEQVNFEVVVVDNQSDEDNYASLKRASFKPNVRLVFSKQNLGFAGGMMLGLQHASPARYYLFLNNDCVFENDCLSVLLDFMNRELKAGLVTAQMYNSEGRQVHSFTHFQTLTKMLFGVGLLRFFHPNRYPHRKGIYTQPLKVDTIAGSFMFFRAETLSLTGGLDTRYFLYCEEEDASMRTKLAGYEVYLVPEARFTHFEGKSTVTNFATKREYFISLMQYQQKFFSKPVQLVFRLLYAVKVGKKFYKDSKYLALAWFIFNGANPSKSLRYKQSINLSR